MKPRKLRQLHIFRFWLAVASWGLVSLASPGCKSIMAPEKRELAIMIENPRFDQVADRDGETSLWLRWTNPVTYTSLQAKLGSRTVTLPTSPGDHQILISGLEPGEYTITFEGKVNQTTAVNPPLTESFTIGPFKTFVTYEDLGFESRQPFVVAYMIHPECDLGLRGHPGDPTRTEEAFTFQSVAENVLSDVFLRSYRINYDDERQALQGEDLDVINQNLRYLDRNISWLLKPDLLVVIDAGYPEDPISADGIQLHVRLHDLRFSREHRSERGADHYHTYPLIAEAYGPVTSLRSADSLFRSWSKVLTEITSKTRYQLYTELYEKEPGPDHLEELSLLLYGEIRGDVNNPDEYRKHLGTVEEIQLFEQEPPQW